MSKILKSAGAVVAGLVFIFATHMTTDAILESAGVLPHGNLFVGTGLILIVILYRTVFSLAGSYLTARLAPQKPVKHSVILGVIGTVLSIMGAIANMKMNLGPDWYAWTLAVTALPIAWAGGKLFEKTSAKPEDI